MKPILEGKDPEFPKYFPKTMFTLYPSILNFSLEQTINLPTINRFLETSIHKNFLEYGHDFAITINSEKDNSYFKALFLFINYMTSIQNLEF